jgi:hypothetical protein
MAEGKSEKRKEIQDEKDEEWKICEHYLSDDSLDVGVS